MLLKKINIGRNFLILISAFTFSQCESQTLKQAEEKKPESKTVITEKTDQMKNNNEIIVDVRTPEEFEHDGHAACSVNYPLNELDKKVDDLKKYNHIVLVCRSGARAGVAKNMLESKGIKNIENKGPWQNATCAN